MKQVLLSEDEHNDILNALEQVGDVYELKARELERSIDVAQSRIKDLRQSRHIVSELQAKVTLAENVTIEFEMGEDAQPEPYLEEADPVHTICYCDICQHKRQSIITDGSIEQMG
jgi:hypothetical protein